MIKIIQELEETKKDIKIAQLAFDCADKEFKFVTNLYLEACYPHKRELPSKEEIEKVMDRKEKIFNVNH